MDKLQAYRKLENYIADNLRGDWSNLSITINKITYEVNLVYSSDKYGIVLRAYLSIPDYDTAMRMTMTDYHMFEYLNNRLETVDFEHYY